MEADLTSLGRALGQLCFPGISGATLANLVDGCPAGTLVEIVYESDDPELLSLAFETACLPDGRVLALQPPVITMRRLLGVKPPDFAPFAGPLKILVAVAAPDEGLSGGAVLDQERELQNILDAVEPAQRHENCQVRILEVGHPVVIGGALKSDAYHVLHLSCHGLPGALEMENEEGAACRTTAAELLDPVREAGRPLPLVLLNSCQGGVPAGEAASLAEALLRGGAPAVLAMQAPVSDFYAIRLADAFYRHLSTREHLLPSRALADAREELERARLAALQRGAPTAETQPEYATASLFVAGPERPIADFA
ncbi:MAG: CHAT domain-containing protein, partial [Acetobacteraceae bacterium]|nr:CHAT domain-containing protein [Acetobacteraceae bacterium]